MSIPKFTIKPAITKVSRNKNFIKVDKKCHAVVIKENDELKARITISPVEECEDFIPQEYIVLPFTPESLNLKGKKYVFGKEKDKYGHYICFIREHIDSVINPGLNTQYDVLKEHLLISGHIVKKDSKQYFNYEQLVAFSENGVHIDNLN